MTGSVQSKHGYWYVVLQYKGKNGKHQYKWVSTGIPSPGNKKKAQALISEKIKEFQYVEFDEDDILLTDYIQDWLIEKRITIKQST